MHVWRWMVHLLISILFIKFQKLLILFSQCHSMNLSHRMWVTRLKIRFVCCECSDYNQLIDFRLFEWWKWCAQLVRPWQYAWWFAKFTKRCPTNKKSACQIQFINDNCATIFAFKKRVIKIYGKLSVYSLVAGRWL